MIEKIGVLIHNFWLDLFPIFNSYEFIYYFLDVVTIIVFFRILFALPTALLKENSRDRW